MSVWMKAIYVTITHGVHNITRGPWQFVHTVHAMTLQEFYKCVPFEILKLFSYLLTYLLQEAESFLRS